MSGLKRWINNYDKKLKEKIAALLEEGKAVAAEEMATMTLEAQLEQTTDSLQQEVIELEKASKNDSRRLPTSFRKV